MWGKERARWVDWAVKKRKQDRDMVAQFLASRSRTLAIIRKQQSMELSVSVRVPVAAVVA